MKKSEKRELMLGLVNKFFEDREESAKMMYAIFEVLDNSTFTPALRIVLNDCKVSWKGQLQYYFTQDRRPGDLYTAQKTLLEVVAFLDLSSAEE